MRGRFFFFLVWGFPAIVSVGRAAPTRSLRRHGGPRRDRNNKKKKPPKNKQRGSFEIVWHRDDDGASDKPIVLVPEEPQGFETPNSDRNVLFVPRCNNPWCEHPKWRKPPLGDPSGYYQLRSKYAGNRRLTVDLKSLDDQGGVVWYNVVARKFKTKMASVQLWRFEKKEGASHGRLVSKFKDLYLTIDYSEDAKNWNAYVTEYKDDGTQLFEFV